ncbi:MAG: acetolactate synthase small subunit [Elusimicrobia bacterium]|nr:acetolactate synthase small subunit [Elusimicrobiota bacterium]
MADKSNDRHTISVLVENRFGVLARIAGLFSARGYNIDSLSVGVTDDPDISRMTIVVRGDQRILEQVVKQLNKLIDIIKVTDYQDTPHIERNLVLVKVNADKNTRSEMIQICDIFRAKIVDVAVDSIIIEMTGDEEKIEALLRMLRPFGVKETCRTGIVAMARGAKGISVADIEKVLA